MSEENEQDRVDFEVRGFVSPQDVPSWTRRPPKWQELMDLINKLEPGQTIVIEFPSVGVANRARNVVRDELNSKIGRAAIRTRLVKKRKPVEGANQAEVYFTRLHPIDIVEADE
jgi:hypothetical protein